MVVLRRQCTMIDSGHDSIKIDKLGTCCTRQTSGHAGFIRDISIKSRGKISVDTRRTFAVSRDKIR